MTDNLLSLVPEPVLDGIVRMLANGMQRPSLVELLGAATGLAGAYLIAIQHRWSRWAFVIWLASNVMWAAFAWGEGHWFLFLQSTGFAIINLRGVKSWFKAPAAPKPAT